MENLSPVLQQLCTADSHWCVNGCKMKLFFMTVHIGGKHEKHRIIFYWIITMSEIFHTLQTFYGNSYSLFSVFSVQYSILPRTDIFFIVWKHKMLDFKNLSTGEIHCVGNALNNSVYVWKRNTDSSQRGRMFKSILKKQPVFKPKDRMKWAQQYKADKQI